MIRFRRFMKLKPIRCGFTLIEMMIVLLVITALLAIAVPAYFRVRENSIARICQTNLREIQMAKERWALDYRKRDADTPKLNELVPSYLKNTPACPSKGIYDIRTVGETPKCSVGGAHTIY